jgi:hypothetical protein
MLLAVLLTLHSWIRWAVVASMIAVVVRAGMGWSAKRPWTSKDASLGRVWVGAVDAQVSVGFVLYFIASPMAAIARQDLAAAWRDESLRFFGILHPLMMVVVAIVTHAAWIWVRRTEVGTERLRRLTLGALGALAFLMLAIPWPFLAYGRPLTRP